jgi:hypothetical protein
LNQILKRLTSRSHYANFRIRTIVDTVATNTGTRRCHNCMVVGFTIPMQSMPITTNVVSLNLLMQGVLDKTLCDKVCHWLKVGRWFSPGTPVSSTNNTDRHDITVILLKEALTTIILILILSRHVVANARKTVYTKETTETRLHFGTEQQYVKVMWYWCQIYFMAMLEKLDDVWRIFLTSVPKSHVPLPSIYNVGQNNISLVYV